METKQCKPTRDPVLMDIYRKNQIILGRAKTVRQLIQAFDRALDEDGYGNAGTETEEILAECQKMLAELLHKIIE